MAKSKQKAKGFVWIATRAGFWLMIGLFALITIIPETAESDTASLLLSFVYGAAIIFTFVNSIIHLTKYKERGFAITALVISSIFLLLFAIGFFYGVFTALSSL